MGKPRSKRFFIARNYSDKAGPITMSDGTPKPLPPTISIDRIANMSPSQLVKFLGPDNGIFFGENAFWKRHSGILLGKHKWEAEGDMERDTNTCSELWDMRWVFGNPENAKNFCKDMVEISRLGQNNGILDGLFKVEIKSSELESLDNSIEDLVFCSNKPLKKPSNNNTQGKFMMSMNPTAYLQSYTAVFVVGQCVVKTYIIEGYNASQKLERSCMFGPKGLLNTIAKTVSAWLDGNRTEFDSRAQQALPSVSSSDLSVCAACGVSQEKLQRCSRCKKVAYCCRGKSFACMSRYFD